MYVAWDSPDSVLCLVLAPCFWVLAWAPTRRPLSGGSWYSVKCPLTLKVSLSSLERRSGRNPGCGPGLWVISGCHLPTHEHHSHHQSFLLGFQREETRIQLCLSNSQIGGLEAQEPQLSVRNWGSRWTSLGSGSSWMAQQHSATL